MLADHHVLALGEMSLFMSNLSWAICQGAMFWLGYIALEPVARRRWPSAMIAWSRLLAGGWRDPLVGRDVLAGLACGALSSSVALAAPWLAAWSGSPEAVPVATSFWTAFLGAHGVAASALLIVTTSLTVGFIGSFLLLLVRLLITRDWIAAVGLAAFFGTLGFLQDHSLWSALVGAMVFGLLLFTLLRFGLVAVMSLNAFTSATGLYPLTTQASAWYAGAGLVGAILLLGLAGYAFHTSLGGQSAFGRVALDE
jgi:hypothetical protein